MHHVRTLFLSGVMTFSYYLMFIHNVFIFKRKAYCADIHSQVKKSSALGIPTLLSHLVTVLHC